MTTQRSDQYENDETNEIFSPFSILNGFKPQHKKTEFPDEIELEANEQVQGMKILIKNLRSVIGRLTL